MPADSAQLDLAAVSRRLGEAGCVFADREAGILFSTARTHDELDRMIALRVTGHPLEQVVGWAEFCGSRVEITEGVFVPRRRTEFLVETAAETGGRGGVLVDLCCGCGAVASAVAALSVPREVHAVDIDPHAIACAKANLRHLDAKLYVGDLFGPLPECLGGHVDVLVASPPYVPTAAIGALPAEARIYEPRAALDGGPDGLVLLRRIVRTAPGWLAPTGRLFLETSAGQARPLAEAAREHGLYAAIHRSEDRESTVVAVSSR